MSGVIRGLLFFGTNVEVSRAAASRASITEAAYAFATAGFYGALTEAFRLCEPPELSNLIVSLGLPAMAHSLEFVVHWIGGTPRLAASIGWSVALSVVTTSFNMFAMRRGAFIVGESRQTLRADLERMPRLVASFVVSVAASASRLLGFRSGEAR
jgi:hypothetical protein